MAVRARWDVGWDEDEVVGRSWREGRAVDDAWSVALLALLSAAVATASSLLWHGTTTPWPLVAAGALAATAVGVVATVRAWRRRVRSVVVLVLLLACVPAGPTVLGWVALGVVAGAA